MIFRDTPVRRHEVCRAIADDVLDKMLKCRKCYTKFLTGQRLRSNDSNFRLLQKAQADTGTYAHWSISILRLIPQLL